MKKFYLFIGVISLGVASITQAQQLSQSAIEGRGKYLNSVREAIAPANLGSRTSYLQEDFSSATFPPTGWTVYSGPASTVTAPTQKWYRSTSGYAAVAYVNSVDQHDEFIQTPGIELPDSNGNYLLTFQFNTSQYWFVDPNDNADVIVTVSNDGGATWSAPLWIEDDQALGEAALAWPWEQSTWTTVQINLSAYAGDSVWVRWNYYGKDAAWFYLDNVNIIDMPGNDLEVLSVSVGDYTKLPVGQERVAELYTVVRNIGVEKQTGITVEVSENGSQVTQSAELDSLLYAQTDTLRATYTPSGLGVKALEFTVSQNEVDENPANNTLNGNIDITEHVFSRDKNSYTLDGWGQLVLSGGTAITEVGHVIETVAAAKATSLEVVLDGVTNVDAVLRGFLYDANLDEIGATDFYTVQSADINTAATASPIAIKLPFFVEIDLEANTEYFVSIKQESDTISVAYDADIRSDDVLVYGTDWTRLIGGGYIPMIRLYVNEEEEISIKEVETSSVNVFPNPATDVVNVTFGEIKGNVVMALFSNDGKVVANKNANVVSGQNVAFDVNGVASGVYTLRVSAENGVYTKKVIIK